MLLGPVFQAEMVANARRGRYFLMRGLFAGGLLLCLWAAYEGVASGRGGGQLSVSEAANLASNFFQAFAWLTMIAALLVTPAIAAGAIASERERRTIEYLFATDLSNAEIVLSKLFGKLLLLGKLVLVALPVLAIFRLLGGIPGNLLVIYFAALASTITLVTVGSLAISVWTPRARDAVIRVYLIEALVLFLPLVFGGLLTGFIMGTGRTTGWLVTALLQLLNALLSINPLWVMGQQMMGVAAGFPLGTGIVWRMITVQVALSFALAVLAVLAVRRVHLRSISSGEGTRSRLARWSLPRFKLPLGERPMLWKEMFARSATGKLGLLGNVALGLLLLCTSGIAIYCYSEILRQSPRSGWNNPGQQYMGVTMTLTVVLTLAIVLLMGLRAASLITYEKERDCWLSLIATPLTGQEILLAKALGNFYAVRWLAAPLALVWLLQLTLMPGFLVAIPLHVLSLATTGLFATAVGLGYSLKLSTSLKSIGATVGTLVFVGGGYLFCCCLPFAIGGAGADVMNIALAGCIPFLQVVPSILVTEPGSLSDQQWILVDYVLGMMFYGGGSLLLLTALVTRFEEIVGRTGLGEGHSGPPIRPQLPPSNSPASTPAG